MSDPARAFWPLFEVSPAHLAAVTELTAAIAATTIVAESKYFFHCFIKGYVTPEGWREDDTVGCMEVKRWEIINGYITVLDNRQHAMAYALEPGSRLYLLANYGQCCEPNGDIIWRCEDGAFGDEDARAA